MIGAGIFAALAPAAAAAGSGLLAGLAVAAVVAYCDATSSGPLATRYPQSGGTYVYGRERLGGLGCLAGWGLRGGQDRVVCGDGVDRRIVPVAIAGTRGSAGRRSGPDRRELPERAEVGATHPRHRRGRAGRAVVGRGGILSSGDRHHTCEC